MARAQKYPWQQWTDGEVYFVDYAFRPEDREESEVQVKTLKNALRIHAYRKGLALRINEKTADARPLGSSGAPSPDDYSLRVMFQFKPKNTAEAAWVLQDESRAYGRGVPYWLRLCPSCQGGVEPGKACPRC